MVPIKYKTTLCAESANREEYTVTVTGCEQQLTQ